MKTAHGEYDPASPVKPPPPPIMLTGAQWWYLIVMLQRLFWFQTEGLRGKKETANKAMQWLRKQYDYHHPVDRSERVRYARLASVLAPLRSMFATNLQILNPLRMDVSGILTQLEWATDHAPLNRVIRALFLDVAKNKMPPFTIEQLMGNQLIADDAQASGVAVKTRNTAPSHRGPMSDEARAAAAARAAEARLHQSQSQRQLIPRKTPIKIVP